MHLPELPAPPARLENGDERPQDAIQFLDDRRFEVPSNDFYWAVTSCRNGQFTATAFHHPTDGFRTVAFDKSLFALDNSGARVNAARRVEPSAFRGDPLQVWRLRVTPQGIEY